MSSNPGVAPMDEVWVPVAEDFGGFVEQGNFEWQFL
jgi:hypothetical protein